MITSAMPASCSYVLTQLDVYDWGAFGGRHGAQIDLAGTAIIGPTGSGKTTLVDALMTLLVTNPRYNLASTGGHESDRDLVSYVRGVSGAGNDGDTNEHIARPGAVVTAIAARFSDGDAVLRIGGLFWLDGTSSSTSDLKRRWLFCQNDTPGLDEWLEVHRDGGARALKELERRSIGLKVYEDKKSFLARLRNHFEVGENAFSLLNRAAGLKQLNSIDTVFRELVLDDRSAFDSARAVANEFDTLAGIRQELEIAKKQHDSLLPIAAGWSDLEIHRAQINELAELKKILPIWFAQQAQARWRTRHNELLARLDTRTIAANAIALQIEQAYQAATAAHAVYLKSGGSDIDRLRGQIKTQETLVARCERAASSYRTAAEALGMEVGLLAKDLLANQRAVAQQRPLREEQFHELQKVTWDCGAGRLDLAKRRETTAQELAEIRKRPSSNIPLAQQHFRHALATRLGLRDVDIPFAAELVKVKDDERLWRGAIERAIGGERLRLLIAPKHAAAALDWMNARDNQLHVRIHEADTSVASARFFEDGFTRKLDFRPHPLREALKHLLADCDRHCVPNAIILRNTPRAMTVEGLMSGRTRYFDKDDARPLDQGWMTGFDNRDQIAALEVLLDSLTEALKLAEAQEAQAREQAESVRRGLTLLDAIGNTVFEDIDLPGAQAELKKLEDELERLTSPLSDAAQAEWLWAQANKFVEKLRSEHVEIKADIQTSGELIAGIGNTLKRLAARIGEGLDQRGVELATRFPSVDVVALDELDEVERRSDVKLQSEISSAITRCNTAERRLIAHLKDAKQIDTGALVEAGSDLEDVPVFLDRLRMLVEEALPEKLSRFLSYLNQSSDQGVTQLLSEIDSEVSVIEERLDDLNVTLERVDFQPGRYLRLAPQRVEHESLRTLRQARAHLRSAQLKDDLGESHYRALADLVGLLRDAVERRKTLGALALLDPRYRLQFAVLVIERGSGKIVEKRTSSQGGSGGEKEIIASYVLTASLSYALCPTGSQRPLFGTIVLDEAFSKSSQAVAGRIIRALSEFGLHPLFVTPNKELRLLREHTRSAIVVHRKGAQATMTSMSWEALEAHGRNRIQRQEHVSEVAR
ncbi:MAG: ATP-binding protein [Pseudomarimonas sp.]